MIIKTSKQFPQIVRGQALREEQEHYIKNITQFIMVRAMA